MRKIKSILFVSILIITAISCKTGQEAATKNKKKLTGYDRQRFEEVFLSAVRSKILGNYDEAAQGFLKSLAIYPECDACCYELAMLYSTGKAGLEKTREALPLAQKAYNLDKENIWYALLLANLYTRNKQYTQANNIYENLLKKNPNKPELYHEWANVNIYAQKYDEAIKIYDRLEQLIGVTEEVSLQKEKIYISQRKFDKAIQEIEKLVNLFPNDANYLGMLAELYLTIGKTDKAFEVYQKASEKNADNPYVNFSLADFYQSQRKYDKAFTYVQKAFMSPDLDIDAKMQVLLHYYEISEKDTAFRRMAYELAEILVSVHPQEAKSYSIYGDLYYRDRKLPEARAMFYKVLALDSSRYPVWEHLMLIESEMSDYVALEKTSASALELFPVQPLPYLMNGISNHRLRKYDKAIQSLKTGKNLVLDNPGLLAEFYSNLGECYNALKKYPESDEAFEKSISLDSSNAFVLNNYSYYLSLRKEKLDKAERYALRANKLVPGQPSFLDTYAWVLYNQKRYEEAKTWIEKAIKQGGTTNAAILEHYGDILFQLNFKEEAIEQWKKALEKKPDNAILVKKIQTKSLIENE